MEFPPTHDSSSGTNVQESCKLLGINDKEHMYVKKIAACISMCRTRHPPILCPRVFGQGNDGVDPWIKRDLSVETH